MLLVIIKSEFFVHLLFANNFVLFVSSTVICIVVYPVTKNSNPTHVLLTALYKYQQKFTVNLADHLEFEYKYPSHKLKLSNDYVDIKIVEDIHPEKLQQLSHINLVFISKVNT